MKIRILCALIFAMVMAFFLLVAVDRSNGGPRNNQSPGRKSDGDFGIARNFFAANERNGLATTHCRVAA